MHSHLAVIFYSYGIGKTMAGLLICITHKGYCLHCMGTSCIPLLSNLVFLYTCRWKIIACNSIRLQSYTSNKLEDLLYLRNRHAKNSKVLMVLVFYLIQ